MYDKAALRGRTGKEAQHVIGKLVGADENESRIETARKTVEFMERTFGKNDRRVKEARRLYETAKARAGI